jgi:acyl-CoA thioester hydrolase
MCIPLQAEFARPEFAPQQNCRRYPNNSQRNYVLPIHDSNITCLFDHATCFCHPLPPRHCSAYQYIPAVDETNFRHVHRVTYADCTVGNHIYYSRYLELLETARGEFFRKLGAPFQQWQEQEIIFPVIECRLRYKAPARYDDLLNIELWLSAAAGIRLNFTYRIVNQAGTLILEGETWHVCTGLNEKPKRLPEELGKLLGPYLRAG